MMAFQVIKDIIVMELWRSSAGCICMLQFFMIPGYQRSFPGEHKIISLEILYHGTRKINLMYSNLNRSDSKEDKSGIIAAYYEFLISANQWLSHKATDVRSSFCLLLIFIIILEQTLNISSCNVRSF